MRPVLTGTLVACLVLGQPAVASDRSEIRDTFQEWKRALRVRDGAVACDLMTRRAKRVVRRTYDPLYDHPDCPSLVGEWGGVMRAQGGGRLLELTVRGRRASAPVAGPGDYRYFLRVDGDWLLHVPPMSERERYR